MDKDVRRVDGGPSVALGLQPGVERRRRAVLRRRQAWNLRALSDNIQETFGLTPVEAMAAGLPCVVSDWNGYKDTVADGETGFRIPTTTLGPGAGIDVADRHAAGVDSYDQLIGITSLATAVDVDACADAGVDALLARLASAPARPADLARDHPGAGRRLLRTLLWLRKFDLVEFRRAATARPASWPPS